jgi:hypothetical protein
LRQDWTRTGRVERAVRRCLVYHGPLPTGALVRSIFGRGRVWHWWYWSIYRAAPKFADKVGRLWCCGADRAAPLPDSQESDTTET